MKIVKGFFCSFWVILPFIALYIGACAIATFIENDYGTSVANVVVYKSWWFNLLHIYFIIALITTLFYSKPWKKKRYANTLLHLSFIVIIIGAGITRFFGFEGMMHIREGEASSSITVSEPTLNIMAMQDQKREFFFLQIPLIASSKFNPKKESVSFFGKDLILRDFDVKKVSEDKRDDTLAISLQAQYDGIYQTFHLVGGKNSDLKFDKGFFKDTQIFMSWGSRNVALPFQIKLNKFELERYAGSNSPSSYASEVEVLDEDGRVIMPYRIFMNNVLDFKGYRFYQSSYDNDEKGTVLSVNKDPGKNITYLGYAMLILGAFGSFFGASGRFSILTRYLHTQKIAIFLAFVLPVCFLFQESYASEVSQVDFQDKVQFIKKFKEKSLKHTKEFSTIQLQNISGRVEPIDTIANNVVHKITKKDNFMGMSNAQMFLGMMLYSDIWRDLKIIYVNDKQIKKIIGLDSKENYASFSDFFSDKLGYKLNNFVEEANRIDPAKRDMFEKNLLKVDERVSLAYSIFSGSFLRIFPMQDGNKWLDPIGIAQQAKPEVVHQVSRLLRDFFVGFDEGLVSGKWDKLDGAIANIKTYQKEYGGDIYLPDKRIKAEILLNQSNFFNKLILPYIILGFLLFCSVLFCIIKDKKLFSWLGRSFYALMLICVLIHTFGLALRWYVSEHSPWSNAYESMLYIAWASAFAGVVFFRKYNLALSASMFLAGISLFVANLGFMDPQITPLVPVLKSYWLNIHVSIITASYGFLGLCFVLGIISLVLFNFRRVGFERIDQSILSLCALNEISMIFGIMMLTVGNFLGGVWANESWGRYWSWDPKETWALISIGVYAIILHLRFLGIQKMPYIFSLASVIGFYSILMTYFGVNYYLSGMHSYAAGDPLPIPMFVYFFVAITILLGIFAYFKSDLKSQY